MKQICRTLFAMLLTSLFCWTCAAGADTVTVWLDDLDLSQMKQEVLRPRAKRAFSGEIMSIGGVKFARGIGTHAKSCLNLDLQGKTQRLIASVGVDEGKKTNPGSVEFLVIGDGKTLWKSGVMKGGEPAQRVEVDLAGVRCLELCVTGGDDGVDSDHADWADARILASEALPHLYPDGADATIPTVEWNKLSSEQLARNYQLETVAPGIWRLRVGQPEKFTPEHFRAEPVRTNALAALPPCLRLPIKVSAIGFRTTGRSCVLELPLQAEERRPLMCPWHAARTSTFSAGRTCVRRCNATTCTPAADACRHSGAWASGIVPRPSWASAKFLASSRSSANDTFPAMSSAWSQAGTRRHTPARSSGARSILIPTVCWERPQPRTTN